MKFKNAAKKLLLEISPTYRKVESISVRIDKMLDTDLTPIGDDKVYISDYIYTPKYRAGLKESKIGQIMNEWYESSKDEISALLQNFFSFKRQYEKIPFESMERGKPSWINGWLSVFDAISLYGFLAVKNPRYYVEVGSGNTTMFVAQAIRDNNLRTKIISIDPFPRAEIDKLCMKIYRLPLENMDLDFFGGLSHEDIFVVDNSHRSFPNSDVTVFFTEILPRLPTGVLYALHDIYLPNDYPDAWSDTQKRWYNEQYLLCTYLLGGAGGDKIKCPICFLSYKEEFLKARDSLWGKGKRFDSRLTHGLTESGGFFWLEKG